MFAVVTNCPGRILPPNQVIYSNAFHGVLASVRYTYTKAGLEQDIILHEQPPAPERFGLDGACARLQALTEFLGAPVPRITATGEGESADQTLSFGLMEMQQGRAFALELEKAVDVETPVAKRWVVVDGRNILFEEVEMARIEDALRALPENRRTALYRNKSSKPVALAKLKVPAPKLAKAARRPMELAKLRSPICGLVLDYVMLTSQANFTFKGDTTYYVSGLVNLSGTTTVEGGAVVKYAYASPTTVLVGGSGLVCQTGPFRPAIFTSKDDDSVGEMISTSTHTPSTISAMYLQVQVGNNPFKYLHFRYADRGLAQSFRPVWHCQFVNCNKAITGDPQGPYGARMELHNVLFVNCNVGIYNSPAYWYGSCLGVAGEHVTADQVGALMGNTCYVGDGLNHPYGIPASALTNSILTGVGSLGATISLVNSLQQTSGTGWYAPAVGGGRHYLSDQTRSTQPGTPEINAALLADLRKKTTHAPVEIASGAIGNTTWYPTAQRDTGCNPEIGYHFDPLDYIVGGININGTLTLAEGVAVGIHGPYGFLSGNLVSTGSPVNSNKLGLYSAVQENPVTSWANASATYLLNSWGSDTRFLFTDITLAGSAGFCSSSAANALQMKNCSLHAARMTISGSYSTATLGFANNIIERCDLVLLGCSGSTHYANFYNNLFLNNGNLGLGHACNQGIVQNFTIKDNLFVRGSFTYGTGSGGAPVIANNGFYQTTVTSQGTNPKNLPATPDFQTGPLGSYYYPTAGGNLSQLIDAGSMTATAAGLGSHTTRADHAADANQVDIGFHYAGVGSAGSDFWIAFCSAPTLVDVLPFLDMSLYISSPVSTTGTIEILGQPNLNFSVTPGTATRVTVPLSAMVTSFDSVESKGVHLTANQPVFVYGVYYLRHASTAFTCYPSPMLGKIYRVMARSGLESGYASQFAIVATEANTTVTITPSTTADLDGHPGTAPFTKTLNQGQTYQINSSLATGMADVTGTMVEADKPIGVFAGTPSGAVLDYWSYANPIVQEQLPVSCWGKQILSFQFSPRYFQGDYYRILAAYDDTHITINGVVTATLQAGEFYENPTFSAISGAVEFKGTKPIQVAQFSHGGTYDVIGDPCEILLPPVGSYLLSYTLTTPTEPDPINPNFTSYVNLIVEGAATSTTFLDGTPVPASSLQPIACSGYYGTRIPVAQGSHAVSSSRPVFVQIYGFGGTDAYGYFGGTVAWPVP